MCRAQEKMGCPCANPPGASGKRVIVVRNPHTLRPLGSETPLSRQDIISGRTRRVTEPIMPQEEDDVTTSSNDEKRVLAVRLYRPTRKPMGGFLSDTIRNQRR